MLGVLIPYMLNPSEWNMGGLSGFVWGGKSSPKAHRLDCTCVAEPHISNAEAHILTFHRYWSSLLRLGLLPSS